ncbi:hypothetical protein KIPB_002724 [Kipferlia bialata]|uniref:Uncharacterized protein n=1 Tax=Kipferlia bialata TaxID=797122 RepID=A0A9K3GGL8_9EUKA|nr:hypothetical protein KIPB_002724 [Kipferlia bialata]|eukprot:g2724.t1
MPLPSYCLTLHLNTFYVYLDINLRLTPDVSGPISESNGTLGSLPPSSLPAASLAASGTSSATDMGSSASSGVGQTEEVAVKLEGGDPPLVSLRPFPTVHCCQFGCLKRGFTMRSQQALSLCLAKVESDYVHQSEVSSFRSFFDTRLMHYPALARGVERMCHSALGIFLRPVLETYKESSQAPESVCDPSVMHDGVDLSDYKGSVPHMLKALKHVDPASRCRTPGRRAAKREFIRNWLYDDGERTLLLHKDKVKKLLHCTDALVKQAMAEGQDKACVTTPGSSWRRTISLSSSVSQRSYRSSQRSLDVVGQASPSKVTYVDIEESSSDDCLPCQYIDIDVDDIPETHREGEGEREREMVAKREGMPVKEEVGWGTMEPKREGERGGEGERVCMTWGTVEDIEVSQSETVEREGVKNGEGERGAGGGDSTYQGGMDLDMDLVGDEGEREGVAGDLDMNMGDMGDMDMFQTDMVERPPTPPGVTIPPVAPAFASYYSSKAHEPKDPLPPSPPAPPPRVLSQQSPVESSSAPDSALLPNTTPVTHPGPRTTSHPTLSTGQYETSDVSPYASQHTVEEREREGDTGVGKSKGEGEREVERELLVPKVEGAPACGPATHHDGVDLSTYKGDIPSMLAALALIDMHPTTRVHRAQTSAAKKQFISDWLWDHASGCLMLSRQQVSRLLHCGTAVLRGGIRIAKSMQPRDTGASTSTSSNTESVETKTTSESVAPHPVKVKGERPSLSSQSLPTPVKTEPRSTRSTRLSQRSGLSQVVDAQVTAGDKDGVGVNLLDPVSAHPVSKVASVPVSEGEREGERETESELDPDAGWGDFMHDYVSTTQDVQECVSVTQGGEGEGDVGAAPVPLSVDQSADDASSAVPTDSAPVSVSTTPASASGNSDPASASAPTSASAAGDVSMGVDAAPVTAEEGETTVGREREGQVTTIQEAAIEGVAGIEDVADIEGVDEESSESVDVPCCVLVAKRERVETEHPVKSEPHFPPLKQMVTSISTSSVSAPVGGGCDTLNPSLDTLRGWSSATIRLHMDALAAKRDALTRQLAEVTDRLAAVTSIHAAVVSEERESQGVASEGTEGTEPASVPVKDEREREAPPLLPVKSEKPWVGTRSSRRGRERAGRVTVGSERAGRERVGRRVGKTPREREGEGEREAVQPRAKRVSRERVPKREAVAKRERVQRACRRKGS